MKIVVLDGYAANPGDLSWEGMKVLGECTIYDRTAPEEVLERAAGAEAILTNKVIINADHMAALPELKYIGVLATGYNVVDTAAAKERGIVVTNIPSYSTASVAQMVFAHILNITQQVQHHSEEVHKGRWANNKDFCFWDTPLMELREKKIGLVGLGSVCIDFQISLPVATGNQKDGFGSIVQRMRYYQFALPAYSGDTRNGKCTPFGYDEADSYFNQHRSRPAYQRTRPCRRFEQWQDLCSRSLVNV